MLPHKGEIQHYFEEKILEINPVSGGDINEAYRIETAQRAYFLKLNRSSQGFSILESEFKGLEILRDSGTVHVAEPIRLFKYSQGGGLILTYYKPDTSSDKASIQLGRDLAALHQVHSEYFGLDHDNHIGSLWQSNRRHTAWTSFYRDERILPQVKLALQKGRMRNNQFRNLDGFFSRVEKIFPDEPPSLTHGDLWSGNYMVTNHDQPIFIDPSVSYCHREMDLAMSKLFGGFSSTFYSAYHEAYPIENNFNARCEIYQLYYLLVHVNLFGGSYVSPVMRIINKYA